MTNPRTNLQPTSPKYMYVTCTIYTGIPRYASVTTIENNKRLIFFDDIRGDCIKWFKGYPNDRTQVVNFNGEQSAKHTLKCGVPYASILGPLFFIIFVNDMFNVSNVLFSVLYAAVCRSQLYIHVY